MNRRKWSSRSEVQTGQVGEGLFAVEDEAGNEVYVDVPQDDYRSIRRAILDLDKFERHRRPRMSS